MQDPNSRYATIEIAQHQWPDGSSSAYLRRRLIPADPGPLSGTAVTRDGERLDLLAARTLGDPTQYWRIADASGVMDPMELTAKPGRLVKLPIGQV